MSDDAPLYTFKVRSVQGLDLGPEGLVAWETSVSCFVLPARHRYCRLPDCHCDCHEKRRQGQAAH